MKQSAVWRLPALGETSARITTTRQRHTFSTIATWQRGSTRFGRFASGPRVGDCYTSAGSRRTMVPNDRSGTVVAHHGGGAVVPHHGCGTRRLGIAHASGFGEDLT